MWYTVVGSRRWCCGYMVVGGRVWRGVVVGGEMWCDCYMVVGSRRMFSGGMYGGVCFEVVLMIVVVWW